MNQNKKNTLTLALLSCGVAVASSALTVTAMKAAD